MRKKILLIDFYVAYKNNLKNSYLQNDHVNYKLPNNE